MAGRGIPAELVRPVNAAATGGLEPDLTLVLDFPPGVGRARQAAAGKGWTGSIRRTRSFTTGSAAAYLAVQRAPGCDISMAIGRPSRLLDAAWAELVTARVRKPLERRGPVQPAPRASEEVRMKQRWGVIGLVAVISFLTGGWLLQRGVASGGNVYQQARLFDDVLGPTCNSLLRGLDRRDRRSTTRPPTGCSSSSRIPTPCSSPATTTRRSPSRPPATTRGLGMQIDVRDGWITVVAPLPETPAERAGIQTGDQIIEVDGKSTEGLEERPGGQDPARRGRQQGRPGGPPAGHRGADHLQPDPGDRSTSARCPPARSSTAASATSRSTRSARPRRTELRQEIDGDAGEGDEVAHPRPAPQPRRPARPGREGGRPVPRHRAGGRRDPRPRAAAPSEEFYDDGASRPGRSCRSWCS